MRTRCLVFSLLTSFNFVSCVEEILPIKGNIVGFVRLLDEEGGEIQDRSGVKVSLTDRISATTDAIGKFEIKAVEAGTYNLLFEKEGYGTFKNFNFVFAGGNRPAVVSNIYLLKLPDIELTQLSVFSEDNLYVEVKGGITESTRYSITYYFGKTEDVSSINYAFTYGFSYCCGSVTTFDHTLALGGGNFQSGEKVYMIMYASNQANQYGLYNYYDYEMGQSINPALNPLTNPIEVTLK